MRRVRPMVYQAAGAGLFAGLRRQDYGAVVNAIATAVTAHPTLYCFAVNAPFVPGRCYFLGLGGR
jgi:hypothetical protein